MFFNKREIEAARHFDGETGAKGSPQTQAYIEQLQRLRNGVQAVRETPGISDAQFSAFMAGIRKELEESPRRQWGRMRSVLSLTAAALLVSISLFAVFFGGPDNSPTKVEAATTEIPGAKVDVYDSGDGSATVWVTYGEGDIW
ncbi:MAG: hypothetical protein AMXMBFR84_34480 [Candidatus Hydrogenedentota bacterium]